MIDKLNKLQKLLDEIMEINLRMQMELKDLQETDWNKIEGINRTNEEGRN